MTGEQRGKKWERAGGTGAQFNRRPSDDSEFVNLELNVKEKEELRAWCVDPIELDAMLEGMFADGTKITVRNDDRNRCIVAFAFPPPDSDNSGYILTGRGASASRALRQLAYKHHVMLDGHWSDYHNRPGARDEDDW